MNTDVGILAPSLMGSFLSNGSKMTLGSEQEWLRVGFGGEYNGNLHAKILMKFDQDTLFDTFRDKEIVKAELIVNAQALNGSAKNKGIYIVTSFWDTSTTSLNEPTIGAELDVKHFNLTSNTKYTFNVTQAINNWMNGIGSGDFGLMLKDQLQNATVSYVPISTIKHKTISFRPELRITYIPNSKPTISLYTIKNQPITNNQIVKSTSDNDFIFKLNLNDTDTSDTIQYQVLFRNVLRTDWTNCEKGIDFTYTIPFNEMLLGKNPIIVKVKDNNGSETSLTFTLLNTSPTSLSQRSVFEVLKALEYENIVFNSLSDLKPTDYNRNTISLQEILNSL